MLSWLRRRRWKPPAQDCAFLVFCPGPLPPIGRVVADGAASDAMTGAVRPVGDAPVGDTPIRPGDMYVVADVEHGTVLVALALGSDEVPELGSDGELPGLDPARMPIVRSARAAIAVRVESTGSAAHAVAYASRLAGRFAALTGGVVADPGSCRHFGPEMERLPREAETSVLAHLSVHVVASDAAEPAWLHTHGLVKFGRPEFEVHDVPAAVRDPVRDALLNLAQYVADGALVRPGETIGDPATPLCVREGRRERAHWGRTPVLELVDRGPDGKPVERGAERGLAAWLASE